MTSNRGSNEPRVSVLLPCYNGAAYIGQALESIINQTYPDFELVVVDDGSTDESADIIRTFVAADTRVRLVGKANGGIVSALNTGLEACRGEYIARMDADDVSFPNRLADQVAWLDTHPACVCVGGYAVDDLVPTPESIRTTGGRHASTDLSVFPPRVAVSMHPLIMVRRDAVVKAGGYRDGFKHAEDYDLFLRLGELGSIDNPPIDMLYYRRHEGAISIRNVEEQEAAAVRAELDAIQRSGGNLPPRRLVDVYRDLRVFRRNQSVNPEQATRQMPDIVRAIFNMTPACLFSSGYFRLRLMMGVALYRYWKRRQAIAKI
ncbi:glycosyltransferase family 2 protein [Sphingomonas sp. TDK1]|uniref:glycosyltransferase family 2 protein n=1 Tax=Sphingomonas sp. TDK1 TaxID=453247 RepID=UPI0007DA0D1B|nr:glycosyltransferase [Sphingomonas sp. TDK1]OAN59467.1 hypothetical protein A7X12_24730 [Sphingomonas sp. TDK1]